MPDVEYAFLADAADARPGQKFSILGGGVTRVGGASFPLVHPHLALVVGLNVTAAELGETHTLRFVMLAPDGSELSRGEAQIRAEGFSAGADTQITFAVDLWSLSFAVPGEYSIRILVGSSERKRLQLTVERATGQAGQAIAPPFPPITGRA